MGSPEPTYWTPLRITLWAAAAVGVSVWLGPRFVEAFRPPEGRFTDFYQEWLSARNYWTGTPVYAPQAEALFRHTGYVPEHPDDMLRWNAHPPTATALTLPLGKLGYRDAQLAWNLLTFPLFLVSLGLILRELDVPLAIWSVFPAVVLLLLCNPVWIQIAQGQLNFPIALLLTLAWVADRHDRPGWAGVAAGVAAGLKLYPAFLFAYFLFARRWSALLTGALAFAAVNGAALAVLGPNEFRTYIRDVIPSLFNYQSSWRNTSLTGFWLRLFNPQPHEKVLPLVVSPLAAQALTTATRLVVVALVGWVSWRARSDEGRDRAFAAAVVGMLLVSPVVWTHYYVLLAVPAGLLWVRLPAGPTRWMMWPVLAALWLPENFFALLAVGPEQAAAMINLRHQPLSPVVNLAALSAFTYFLSALFVLVLLLPADEPAAGWAAPRLDTREDEARLNRRLFGPDSGP